MCTQIEAGKSKETTSEVMERAPSEHSSLLGLNDAADEFFDVPEPTDYEQSEAGWTSDFGPEISQVYIKVIFFLHESEFAVNLWLYCRYS